jgi:phenol 2-monooxygenase
MGVSYDGMASPLVKESQHDIWNSGHRCPDIIIKPISGTEDTRLYTVASYGKFIVLFIGQHPEASFEYGSVAGSYHVSAAGDQRQVESEAEAETMTVGKRFTAQWVKAEDSFVVVVRPDMYIGYVASGDDSWKQYLDEVLVLEE